MSDLEFHRRLSAVERRLSKLEDGYKELDNVVDPKGWIGEAFELLEKDVDEVKQQLQQMDGKIDVILQHLTGMNKG